MNPEQEEKLDRMFKACADAVAGIASLADVARAASEAFGGPRVPTTRAEEWPEVVLEDMLDAEYIED